MAVTDPTAATIGWILIGGLGYIVGRTTTAPTRMRMAGGRMRGMLTLDRVAPVGGLLAGLAFGPEVFAALGAVVGGFFGGVVLSGVGLSTTELAVAGLLAAVVFALLYDSADED